MQVVYTRRALRDLAAIHTHIAADNPAAASRMAVELVAACDRLEQFPERGRTGRRRATHELTTVWPYVIVYKITREGVDILAIWHGAQRWR
jgi:toxin ParE1/3/4